MRKNDERMKRESCFNKALPTEWLFVLLARDPAAPVVVRMWCEVRVAMGLNEPDDPQIIEALKWCEQAMVQRAEPMFAVDVALRKAAKDDMTEMLDNQWRTEPLAPLPWRRPEEFEALYLNHPPSEAEAGELRRAITAAHGGTHRETDVFCHACSLAAEGGRAVYHAPPVCADGWAVMVHGVTLDPQLGPCHPLSDAPPPPTCRKCEELGIHGEGVLVGGLCYDHAERCERCDQPMDPTVPHDCKPSTDPEEWPHP